MSNLQGASKTMKTTDSWPSLSETPLDPINYYTENEALPPLSNIPSPKYAYHQSNLLKAMLANPMKPPINPINPTYRCCVCGEIFENLAFSLHVPKNSGEFPYKPGKYTFCSACGLKSLGVPEPKEEVVNTNES